MILSYVQHSEKWAHLSVLFGPHPLLFLPLQLILYDCWNSKSSSAEHLEPHVCGPMTYPRTIQRSFLTIEGQRSNLSCTPTILILAALSGNLGWSSLAPFSLFCPSLPLLSSIALSLAVATYLLCFCFPPLASLLRSVVLSLLFK